MTWNGQGRTGHSHGEKRTRLGSASQSTLVWAFSCSKCLHLLPPGIREGLELGIGREGVLGGSLEEFSP